jgi:Ser/Thr protein kinase RdoA (MazF antagonist)
MAKGPRTVLVLPDGIAERWNLAGLREPVPLGGGYHSLVARAGDFVVRIEQSDVDSVAWEHELLEWLGEEIPEVVAPVAAADGTTFVATERGIVSVLPFVDGTPRGGLEAAELFARIHRRGADWAAARPRPGRPAYADLDWERNDWWDWSVVRKPPELVRAFDRARAWVASAPELVVTPIHGDPAQQNVLWDGRRIVGVLDWEWSRLDWPALELASAAWAFAERDVDGFVAAYVAAGGPGEPDVLQEGVRIFVLANALYSLSRETESDQDWIDFLLAWLRELP